MRGDIVSSGLAMVPWIAVSLAVPAPAQVFWINEFHYDNTGSDRDEFVEIVAPADFTGLADVRLTLYNGGDGTPYGSTHALSTFTPGETVGPWRLYSKAISGIQNGAPDGLSLDLGGAVVQFLSYEGGFTASAGPALGLPSTALDVHESETTPAGASLGLTGGWGEPWTSVWTAHAIASPGRPNPGQAAVPEPGECALVAAGGLAALAWWRHRGGRKVRKKSLGIS